MGSPMYILVVDVNKFFLTTRTLSFSDITVLSKIVQLEGCPRNEWIERPMNISGTTNDRESCMDVDASLGTQYLRLETV